MSCETKRDGVCYPRGTISSSPPRPPQGAGAQGGPGRVNGEGASLIDLSAPPQPSPALLSSWPQPRAQSVNGSLAAGQLAAECCYLPVTHLSGHGESSLIKFVTDFNPITVQTCLISPSGRFGFACSSSLF